MSTNQRSVYTCVNQWEARTHLGWAKELVLEEHFSGWSGMSYSWSRQQRPKLKLRSTLKENFTIITKFFSESAHLTVSSFLGLSSRQCLLWNWRCLQEYEIWFSWGRSVSYHMCPILLSPTTTLPSDINWSLTIRTTASCYSANLYCIEQYDKYSHFYYTGSLLVVKICHDIP